jgi:hypothetical protein
MNPTPAPTERQILGASIRAEAEEYDAQARRPHPGGWEYPEGHRERRNAHLALKFGVSPQEAGRFMTYSRSCTHSWKEGACYKCPK